MGEEKKGGKKTRIVIRDLGAEATKKISKEELKAIRGGGDVLRCPSKECRALTVIIATQKTLIVTVEIKK